MNSYELRLAAAATAGTGAFLLLEHLYFYGFELSDLIGHEFYGLILILAGCGIGVLAHKKKQQEGLTK